MDMNKKKAELLEKARKFLKREGIEDPTGRLAQKCANEEIQMLKGERKS